MTYSPYDFIQAHKNILDYSRTGIDFKTMSAETIRELEAQYDKEIAAFFATNSNQFPVMQELLSYDNVKLDLHDSLVTHVSLNKSGKLIIKLNSFVYDKEKQAFNWSIVQDVTFEIMVRKLPEKGLKLSRNATIDLLFFNDKEVSFSFWEKNTGKELVQTIEFYSLNVEIGNVQNYFP